MSVSIILTVWVVGWISFASLTELPPFGNNYDDGGWLVPLLWPVWITAFIIYYTLSVCFVCLSAPIRYLRNFNETQ